MATYPPLVFRSVCVEGFHPCETVPGGETLAPAKTTLRSCRRTPLLHELIKFGEGLVVQQASTFSILKIANHLCSRSR